MKPRRTWATVLVLLLVPLLVAGGLLWGTSRADAGLREVQAAVVNNDEMVTVNGQVMPLGRQLAAELVDSDRDQNFTWVLASEAKAAEGLKSGRYAAVVTIPKEFSAAASSFSKPANEAVRATIHVETSPVAGISEASLGQSIADAAANSLNRFLTGEYLKNIYLGFNQMSEQMLTMVDGTRKLADGAGQLADGASQSADGAGALADGLGQAAAGSPQLRDGAAQSASGAKALADGLGLASAGGAQLRDGVNAATSGAHQLSDGATTLAGGTRQWASGADTYANGVDTFAGRVQTYADGVGQYTGTISGLIRPIRDAVAQLPEWAGWIDQIKASVADLTDNAIKLDQQIQAVIAQLRDYVTQTFGLAEDASSLATSASSLTKQAKAARASVDTAVACPAELADVEGACDAFAAGVAAAGKQVSTSNKAFDASIQSFQADADALAAEASRNEEAGRAILDLLDRLSAASTKMVAWAPTVQAELQKLESQIPAGTPTSKAEVLALLDQFLGASDQLASGGQQLAAGGSQLAGGARQLADGARGLADGTTQFAAGVDGLASGLDQLGTGVAAYTGGVDTAASGASQLAGGLGQLSTGIDQYTGGVDMAAAGASQLAGGLGQLSDGARGLADGTGELADGVAKGADAIPTYSESDRDRLSEVVAAPVDTSAIELLARPSLSWVSLLLVSALWVGALATFAATGGTSRRAALSTASSGQLLGRAFLPGLGIIAGQGVLLSVLGSVALKLNVAEGALLTLALLVASGAFALVNFALARLFGNGGRVASLALLMVTIVTAATSTAPSLFGALRALSPVSPALDAVREVSTTGNVTIPLFILAGWAILGAAGAVFAVARTRMVPLSTLTPARA